VYVSSSEFGTRLIGISSPRAFLRRQRICQLKESEADEPR
jgi:hypothetical protein